MGNITIHQDKIRKDGFTVVGNTILRDNRVTARAKGVFCYLLNLPPDWTLHIDELAKNFAEGRDAIRKAISELIDFGYVVKIVEMNGNLKGRTHYNICECPERSQVTESRGTKTRYAENPTLINTYDNKDLDNNNLNSNSSEPNGSSEFANDESARVSEDSDNTHSSPTISEESHTHSDNTKSNVVSSSTAEEKKVVPSGEKEFWGSLEDLETPKAEPKAEKKSRNYFKVPTIGEIAQYISENNYLVDAEGFYHYYRDRNWCAGRKKIDWKDKVRQWDLDRRAKGKNYGYKKQPASPYNLDIKNQSFSEENWK